MTCGQNSKEVDLKTALHLWSPHLMDAVRLCPVGSILRLALNNMVLCHLVLHAKTNVVLASGCTAKTEDSDDILGICGCTVWGDLARQASGTPVEQYFQDWGSRSLFTYERLNIYWCGPRYRIWFFVVDVKTMAGHFFFFFIGRSSFLLRTFGRD